MSKDPVGEYTLEVMKEASWYNEWLFSYVKKYYRSGDILEVGTGIGNFTSKLKGLGNVTSIDLNNGYINKLKKEPSFKEVNLGIGDIENGKYFFKRKKFASIICFNVLEHIKNDKKALKNMHSLLEKGGKLILLVPAHKALYSKYDKYLGHFRRYNKENIDKLLKTVGFSEIKLKYINWWGAIGWFFYMKIFKFEKFPSNEVQIFNILGKIFLWPEKIIEPPFGLSVLAVYKK